MAGIAGGAGIGQAAIIASGAGDSKRASQLIGLAKNSSSLSVGSAAVVVDLLAGKASSAEQQVRRLKEGFSVNEIDLALNRAAALLMRDRRTDAALTLLEFNASVFPESWMAWNSLGAAYFRLGRTEEALEAYQKVLELNPGHAAAKRMIERIKKKKQNPR